MPPLSATSDSATDTPTQEPSEPRLTAPQHSEAAPSSDTPHTTCSATTQPTIVSLWAPKAPSLQILRKSPPKQQASPKKTRKSKKKQFQHLSSPVSRRLRSLTARAPGPAGPTERRRSISRDPATPRVASSRRKKDRSRSPLQPPSQRLSPQDEQPVISEHDSAVDIDYDSDATLDDPRCRDRSPTRSTLSNTSTPVLSLKRANRHPSEPSFSDNGS